MPNFELFRCDYQDTAGKPISVKDQAEQILQKVSELNKRYPKIKIGITFSTDQKQAFDIKGKYTLYGLKISLKGSNQAEVIQVIFGLLEKEPWKELQQVFRVIPIVTKKYVDSKSYLSYPGTLTAVEDSQVENCLEYANKFMADGHLLLGWTNQDSKGEKIAIVNDETDRIITANQRKLIIGWCTKLLNSSVKNSYPYQVHAGCQGRPHKPFGFFSSWEVCASHFQGLNECYNDATGDYLKTRILDDFNQQIQGCKDIESLNDLKATFKLSVKFAVLNTGQDVFMYLFGQLFGIKTSSVKALEQMFHDKETNLSESLAR